MTREALWYRTPPQSLEEGHLLLSLFFKQESKNFLFWLNTYFEPSRIYRSLYPWVQPHEKCSSYRGNTQVAPRPVRPPWRKRHCNFLLMLRSMDASETWSHWTRPALKAHFRLLFTVLLSVRIWCVPVNQIIVFTHVAFVWSLQVHRLHII